MLCMVRYNGRYWNFEYPSLLRDQGETLVDTIPTEPEAYRTWLNAMRSRFFKWDAVLQDLLCIPPAHLATIGQDEFMVGALGEAFDAHLLSVPTYDNRTSVLIRDNSCCYTLDLDLEVFSIQNEAHYQLGQIPRDRQWIHGIRVDNDRVYFVIPTRVPHQSPANLVIPMPQLSNKDRDYWNFFETRPVDPRLMDESSVSLQIRWKLLDLFQGSQADALSVSLLSWTAEDFHFRELTYFIICLAFGGEFLTLFDLIHTRRPPGTDLYKVVCGDTADSERELISSVCSGFHLKDHPVGSAPLVSKYWFEGALVCLVPRLHRTEGASNAIADAVRYGRDHGRTSFNAVLISIAHLVLVRSFPDGYVDHSPIMPLMAIQGYRGMDATQRHGEHWLEAFADMDLTPEDDEEVEGRYTQWAGEKAKTKKDILKGESQKLRERTCWNFQDDGLPDDEDHPPLDRFGYRKAEYQDEDLEESWTIQKTISRFVKFWDAAVQESLTPNDCNGRGLPVEIIEVILSYVTDMKTYNACAKVSRTFRDVCFQRALLMDDLIFFDAPLVGWVEEEDDERDENEGGEDDKDDDDIPDIHPVGHDSSDDEEEEDEGDEDESFEIWGPSHEEDIQPVVYVSSDDEEHKSQYDPACEEECDRYEFSRATKYRLSEHPKFYVVRQSTGRQMTVKLGEGARRDKMSAFEIVIGSERHRKSFCIDCPVTILGLDVATDDHVRMYNEYDWEYDDHPAPPSSDYTTSWKELDDVSRQTKCKIRELGNLWEEVICTHVWKHSLSPYGRVLRRLFEHEPWLMPPNTIQYVMATDPEMHVEYTNLIYLRLKRTSRYVDVLWDDLVQEAKDSLCGMMDVADDFLSRMEQRGVPWRKERAKRLQSVGSGNPSVILAIGFDVRLFEWHVDEDNGQGGTLKETLPGKIYSLLRAEDRLPIDEVIMAAIGRLKMTKRLEAPEEYWGEGERANKNPYRRKWGGGMIGWHCVAYHPWIILIYG